MTTHPDPTIYEQLLRRMEEVAALPPHDPQRIELLAEIIEAGPEAEAHWIDLIADDERARLDLLRVHPPAGLAERLHTLPHDHLGSLNLHPNPFLRPRLWATVGAAACVIFAVSLTVGQLNRGLRLDRQFNNLGAMAANHHELHEPHARYTFRGPDAAIVTAGLRAQPNLPFEATIPTLGPEYKLLGARICQLGGEKVACTQWERNGKTYTLYQFCPDNFDMPDTFARRNVALPGLTHNDPETAVTFWAEGQCAYALVDNAL
ncbi:MAG: hypothetical protein ACYTGQ_14195 [Planctomycetota bacterium]|jgi:hypothetical protein